MPPSCPYCDHPDTSVLRLVLISAIVCADETLLVLLADVWQQSGLLPFAEEPKAPHMRRRKDTLQRSRRPGADRP
jgi:hypothetical protein